MKKPKSRESIISEVESQMGYYDIPEAEPSISFTGKSVCELVDLAKILMAENDELDEAAHNKSLEVMKLQSALDTQKPAGDALTGDCGGGDLEPINCLEEAIALSASACYMEGVRAYYDTTWIEALVEASRRYLALTADNAERGE